MAATEEELREREVVAFEGIGAALITICAAMVMRNEIEQAWFDKKYPVRGEVRDAEVTHLKTEEERLREEQGDTGETDEEWIGSREAGLIKRGKP